MFSLLAAAELTMDGPYWISILSRVIHTTCGATILGGLIYLRFVLVPTAIKSDDVCEVVFTNKRRTWALCIALCSALLIASGLYNLLLFTDQYQNLPKLYHPLFGIKFLLSLGVMFIAAVIAGKTKLAERVRSKMTLWLNIVIVLALAVFVLGAILRSCRDLPAARIAPIEEISIEFDGVE